MTEQPGINDSIADPTDPYEREAQTFPKLTDDQARRIVGYGKDETLSDGTLAFERGQRSVDFFFVLHGAIEIFDLDAQGRPNVFTTHAANQFTGEMDLFNDRQILVSGRAAGETRVVRVKRPDFRRLIAAETDIGETIMRAFILRRVGLIRYAQGGVQLVGSGHDGDTDILMQSPLCLSSSRESRSCFQGDGVRTGMADATSRTARFRAVFGARNFLKNFACYLADLLAVLSV